MSTVVDLGGVTEALTAIETRVSIIEAAGVAQVLTAIETRVSSIEDGHFVCAGNWEGALCNIDNTPPDLKCPDSPMFVPGLPAREGERRGRGSILNPCFLPTYHDTLDIPV